jgi:hypothetical protein
LGDSIIRGFISFSGEDSLLLAVVLD